MIVFPGRLRMYLQRDLTWRKALRKVNQSGKTNSPSTNQRHIMQNTQKQREDSGWLRASLLCGCLLAAGLPVPVLGQN